MLKCQIFLLFLIPVTFLYGQTKDNVLWASFKVQKKLDQKTSLALAPILRLNDDLSNYQNFSIDLSIKRKIAKEWSLQLLGRTWFIPDAKIRQFLWLDVIFSKRLKNFNIASNVRLHYALDLFGNKDSDFIRWKTTLKLLTLGKIQPFISIEPWFQLNGQNSFRQIRYEPGLSYKINDKFGLLAMYRRQATIDIEPEINFNMIVVTLSYMLP